MIKDEQLKEYIKLHDEYYQLTKSKLKGDYLLSRLYQRFLMTKQTDQLIGIGDQEVREIEEYLKTVEKEMKR